MNNSENSANALAQADRITSVLKNANKKGYNWLPLLERLTYFDDPESMAKHLLDSYFKLSYYIAGDGDECGHPDAQAPLYYLRSLYEAISVMNDGEDTGLIFVDGAESGHGSNDTKTAATGADRDHQSMVTYLMDTMRKKDDIINERAREMGGMTERIEYLERIIAKHRESETKTK